MNHLSMDALLSLREPGREPGTAAAQEHLHGCPHCQAELERLHQRVARIKALPPLRPGRDRWPETAARFRAERSRHRIRLAGLSGLAAAASVALALGIGRPADSTAPADPTAEQLQEAMIRSQALERGQESAIEMQVLPAAFAKVHGQFDNFVLAGACKPLDDIPAFAIGFRYDNGEFHVGKGGQIAELILVDIHHSGVGNKSNFHTYIRGQTDNCDQYTISLRICRCKMRTRITRKYRTMADTEYRTRMTRNYRTRMTRIERICTDKRFIMKSYEAGRKDR